MRNTLTIFLLLFNLILNAQNWDTDYEKSDFKKTPTYAETIDYCQRLADASPLASMVNLGLSPQGNAIPMMIIDRDGLKTPEAIRAKGRIVVLVQACIHPGEPEGKDAMLLLIRDLIIHRKQKELLEKASILFIPIFNVDGHERFGPYNRINQNGPEEMGWRTNALNLNLNRDFLKAESPEMQHWLKMYTQWLPEFFIDIHTSDGADYQYPLTYSIEISGNLDSGLTRWLNNIYEPRITGKMKEAGYPIFPYVQFRKWHDPRSGLRTGPAPSMISQGYAAVQNRPALLIETHMLKNYKTRVDATYQMLTHSLFILNHQAETLKTLIDMADKSTASPNFRTQKYPLCIKTSQTDSTMVQFEGFEYKNVKSDLTGGDWFIYDNTRPVTMTLPFFNKTYVETETQLPEAYLIPAEWASLAGKLKLHGIKMNQLTESAELNINSYKFHDCSFSPEPNEGHQKVNAKYDEIVETRKFPKGSFVILTNQRTAKVIAAALEPASPGSFFEWGYFNTILEQKEYSETYVMETMAREMLNTDANLKKEFETRMKDPDFAGSQWNILNWFYSKTPYWDNKFNIYPVGRVFEKASVTYLKNISVPVE
ncbi:MAG: M14 family metallopeptidase [Lentimicrobiaceae bacterium]|nr:M14 family metallopeptidase [Lentimicrobiaceae bacterium]MCB9023684.1 M14 family metallopeptidase [Lentimicrobiaceae bacterium]HPG32579.1 M14 family metallopeptidase [Lentimicrobium sp.]